MPALIARVLASDHSQSSLSECARPISRPCKQVANVSCSPASVSALNRRSFLSVGIGISLVALQADSVQAVERVQDERRGLARYVRKKKLDPLQTYVPPVLAARNQLTQAGSIMKDDLQSARTMLRSGAFDGLRDNIKALGEYANQQGTKDSKKLVDGFFLAVQDFDYTLFQAKRYEQAVGDTSDAALQKTLSALDKLLATVPQKILEDSEKIVQAVNESSKTQPTVPKEKRDQELDQLVQLVPG